MVSRQNVKHSWDHTGLLAVRNRQQLCGHNCNIQEENSLDQYNYVMNSLIITSMFDVTIMG